MSPPRGALASSIRPFDGYLPRPDLAVSVIAPNYDSLSMEDQGQPRADSPLAFLNLVRSEIDHPEYSPNERHDLLDRTAQQLGELLRDGIYRYYPAPLYVVCRLEQRGHTQTGVIADVALDAYERGLVKIHESTRKGQEDRLVEYMHVVPANFLPVFLIHRPRAEVDAAVAAVTAAEPTVTVSADDDLNLALWVVDDPDALAQLEEALAALDELYVADGHHRAAAAARYAETQPDGPGRHLLSVLFPADQLVIHGYNRCVADLAGQSPDELLAALGERFAIESLHGATAAEAAPRSPGEFSMLLGATWHRLRADGGDAAGVAGLDVTLLQEQVLAPLLGVNDPRFDPRIEFVPGTLGLEELENMCAAGYAVGFGVYPMSVDQLMAVADRRELMPPKSTWFAPKLRSGLVVRLF